MSFSLQNKSLRIFLIVIVALAAAFTIFFFSGNLDSFRKRTVENNLIEAGRRLRLYQYKDALGLYQRTKRIVSKKREPHIYAEVLHGLGSSKFGLHTEGKMHKNLDDALEFYIEAVGIFDQLDDAGSVAAVSYNLGRLYHRTGLYLLSVERFENALVYYDKALDFYSILEYPAEYGQTFLKKALTFERLYDLTGKPEYLEYSRASAEGALLVFDQETTPETYAILKKIIDK
jgi:tetratricopeptide (TPR) repeat protein